MDKKNGLTVVTGWLLIAWFPQEVISVGGRQGSLDHSVHPSPSFEIYHLKNLLIKIT